MMPVIGGTCVVVGVAYAGVHGICPRADGAEWVNFLCHLIVPSLSESAGYLTAFSFSCKAKLRTL